MNDDKIFVDSNVFLYILDNMLEKRKKAVEILSNRPVISTQVVFENINVAVKKFRYSPTNAVKHGRRLLAHCTLSLDTEKTIEKALELFQKDSLQVYDSRIVASALEAGCNILYSEDLQHLRVFEGKLTVVNPFII
jgi:predicted nucleic acid-binding protein